MNLSATAKSHLRLIQELAKPEPIFLVGGAVRDLLVEREVEDLDLVVARNAVVLASKFARAVKGALVVLDQKLDIARVVTNRTKVYDFAGFRGRDLQEDLRLRDFTLNAIAVELAACLEDRLELIDPLDGKVDLEQGIIRTTNPSAFLDDPLRLLRAFRFAAMFDFQLEPTTADQIRRDAALLTRSAPERIKVELAKMLAFPQATPHFQAMIEHGLGEALFPELGLLGIGFNRCAQGNTAIRAMADVETWLNLPELWAATSAIAPRSPRLQIPYPWLLKLGALVSCLPLDCQQEATAQARTPAKTMIDTVRSLAQRLRFSSGETEFLMMLLNNFADPISWFQAETLPSELDRDLYRLFYRSKNYIASILGLTAVHLTAMHHEHARTALQRYAEYADQVLVRLESVILPRLAQTAMLNGRELQAWGLAPGPRMGKILAQVQEAIAVGEIATRQDVELFARGLIERQGNES